MTTRLGAHELEALARLGTATIGEVGGARIRIIDGAIRPLDPSRARVAGHAFTVRCGPGDNLAIHLALARIGAGDMLVVDYGGSEDSGPFGEIMALAAQTRGAVGLVIDGAVRDRAEIIDLGFPVWSRGIAIPGTTKVDRGLVGQGCRLSGTDVDHGDIVVADADAVVVFDPGEATGILERGTARLEREAMIMERIRAGETTCEILGLD
ncbi:RraA family protein [Roseibacterium sp. SDUM158017]|uniref:RraA family protein n=1 Tax=Roseicyclus salinarum TaxID=3036773 RepID=UPI0024153704|nr:RraA family protein [Roseibacterium sp. SDUM158017]MDG4649281.1 RraA family protein [Roseibacterium sp. SDUM158017]